jgi:hypothetical protein
MAQHPREIAKSGLRLASQGKIIHLKDFLPGHLEQSEVADFVEFFENFLNTLYYHDVSAIGTNDDFDIDSNGVHTYYATSSTPGGDYYTSADPNYDTSALPVRYEITSADTVSILEKARRIADLHDPDLIDIEYIQRLANFLGYDVLVDKSGITDVNFGYNANTEEDINSYIKFIISNLPNWYKIKTTRDAVKVLLYSFGIVGDIIYRWTSDNVTSANPTSGGYGNDANLWQEPDSQSSISAAMQIIPDNYFPTPHFSIQIDANNTSPGWFVNIQKIIDALETIRPINNVFHSVSIMYQERLEDVYVRMDTYDRIKTMFPQNDVIPTWTPQIGDIIVETGAASIVFEATGDASDDIIET